MITENSQKSHTEFVCINCDYKCCRKSDYNKHLSTAKHKNNDNSLPKTLKKYTCSCGKEYSFRQGLYLHKQKCKENIEKTNNTEINDKDLIKMLINDNKELRNLLIDKCNEKDELKNIMLEVIKNGTHNTTNTNSHNKTFNLQFFLNDTCKDAMNIMDFVDSIKLQLSDLENVGKLGFVEGISNIIVKKLNSLDETKRPVHCTDSKREVMYVKDENKWEKENNDNLKMRKAIKNVAYKNSKMLSEFRKKHPDCLKSNSKVSDQYNKLVFEAFGGKGDNDSEKEDKIIKNIAKEVTIEK